MIKKLLLAGFLSVISLSTVACAVTDESTLPEEYVECTNHYTEEVFRYVPQDATIYPDAFCVVDSCVDWYVIIDLQGEKHEFNNLEMENEWFCTIKTVDKE